MIDITEVEVGKRYNCEFTAQEVPLDEFGRPGGSKSLADLPVVRLGDYASSGELVEVLCDKTNKKFVVRFNDLENITESDD